MNENGKLYPLNTLSSKTPHQITHWIGGNIMEMTLKLCPCHGLLSSSPLPRHYANKFSRLTLANLHSHDTNNNCTMIQ
jgi:hypothetical protein